MIARMVTVTIVLFATAAPLVEAWVSTEGYPAGLLPASSLVDTTATEETEILVDDSTVYQTVLGIGSSLEPTTCYNLSQLTDAQRNAVLVKLFDPIDGIGMNLARVCIGTPDFTGDDFYTYRDTPEATFTIDRDRRYILPMLREALAVNPDLRFYASPWSPPGWMTSTGDLIGGRLLPEHYSAYARYFVAFVQAYADAGIPIHAVTVQNEPGVDRSRESDPKWHYPSCRWTAEEEAKFIANHLGPAFEAAGVSTEIWTYDHNFNESPGPEGDDPGIDYPRTVLLSDAAKYVRGVAFHGYWGRPSGMSVLHRDFPAVPVYFTEGSMYGAKGALTIIDIFRNHASSYNAWVTMIDDARGPNNGPFEADWTMAVHDRETNSVSYTFDYFMYGQFSKFVKRGAVRVDSTEGDRRVNNVAFRNPDGSMVVIVSNAGADNVARTLRWNEHSAELTLPPRSVVTLRWTSGTG